MTLALLQRINLITTNKIWGSVKKWLILQLRGKTQDEPGASCAAGAEVLKKGWGVSDRHRNRYEVMAKAGTN